MSEQPTVRGVLVTRTAAFIDRKFDPEQRERIYGQVSSEVRDALPKIGKNEFYPRGWLSQYLGSIARHYDDPQRGHDDIVECGLYHGNDATGTFLRLLVKFLTPKVFSRKFPELWAKDFRFGTISSNTDEADARKRIEVMISDVDGFDWFAPLCTGYFKHIFATMGKKSVQVVEKNCPVGTPSVPSLHFTISWT